MLDSRAPPSETKISYFEQEALAEQRIEQEASRLLSETRLWRLANSVQWVAWGIVQAQVPGMPDFGHDGKDKEVDGEASKQAKVLDSATGEMRAEAEAEAKKKSEVSGEEDAGRANDDEAEDKVKSDENADQDPQAEDEEFDYLGYAQERAMFVWGDAIRLGIVTKEELPEGLWERIKIVEY